MDRIYTIIQKENMKRVLDEILVSLDKLGKREASAGETSTYSKQEIVGINASSAPYESANLHL